MQMYKWYETFFSPLIKEHGDDSAVLWVRSTVELNLIKLSWFLYWKKHNGVIKIKKVWLHGDSSSQTFLPCEPLKWNMAVFFSKVKLEQSQFIWIFMGYIYSLFVQRQFILYCWALNSTVKSTLLPVNLVNVDHSNLEAEICLMSFLSDWTRGGVEPAGDCRRSWARPVSGTTTERFKLLCMTKAAFPPSSLLQFSLLHVTGLFLCFCC